MKALTLSFLLLLFAQLDIIAQTDTSTLLNDIESRLKKQSTSVSAILNDQNYRHFHSFTPFQELIKKYCTTAPVKIAMDTEPGKKIKVIAALKDEAGKGIAGAVVYFYQSDAKGWYAADKPHVGGNSGDQRHARLFGYAKTDASGKFEIHTVKPSGYPQSDLPAHIHVEITGLAGYQPRITEFLFDDDERLVGNIRANVQGDAFIISEPERTDPHFNNNLSIPLRFKRINGKFNRLRQYIYAGVAID